MAKRPDPKPYYSLPFDTAHMDRTNVYTRPFRVKNDHVDAEYDWTKPDPEAADHVRLAPLKTLRKPEPPIGNGSFEDPARDHPA